MNFPIAYRESNERCWVEDAAGRPLLFAAWEATVPLIGKITDEDKAKDLLARETLKELVGTANRAWMNR